MKKPDKFCELFKCAVNATMADIVGLRKPTSEDLRKAIEVLGRNHCLDARQLLAHSYGFAISPYVRAMIRYWK